MRRLAVLSLLSVGLLAGCSQVSQVAGDIVGVPVEELCGSLDDVFAQYEQVVESGQATEEQLAAARDALVERLDGLADDVGGETGDLIRTQAEALAAEEDLSSPATVQRADDALTTFCG